MPRWDGDLNTSDARRDAQRYGNLLLALERAVDAARDMERTEQLDVGELLASLLPELAEGFNAESAFVALLKPAGAGSEPWLEVQSAFPKAELSGQHLPLSSTIRGLLADGRSRVMDPLGEDPPPLIPGLEALRASSAVIVRTQTLTETRIVGICNKRDASAEPYLGSDGRLLDKIIELVAIGARIEEHYLEETKRQSARWQALYEAGKAISAGAGTGRKEVLDRIVEQAVERLWSRHGSRPVLGVMQLYDPLAHELRFESAYPGSLLASLKTRLGERRSVNPALTPGGRIGITGRAVLERKALRVSDVRADTDYVTIDPQTRSELAVPLLDGERVTGVLSLESAEPAAFDEDDEQALSGLAELAVIAIKSSDQADHLSRANAVAMMGAWGADLAHDVNRQVGSIRRAVMVLGQARGLSAAAKERLHDIDVAADSLAALELPDEPSVPGRPLLIRDAAPLDSILQAEVEGFRTDYPNIEWRHQLHCSDMHVAMHGRWLRRVLRHLMRNAYAAGPATGGCITVRSSCTDEMAQIEVEDRGRGIEPAVEALLFRQPINGFRGPSGPQGKSGRGLLLSRFLVEQHGGAIWLKWTAAGKGSCFAFTVPLAAPVLNAGHRKR